jgi:hypothetical protein
MKSSKRILTTYTTVSEEEAPKRLLDNLNISDYCVLAFSLYKVIGDYEGNCLKVRRSSDDATLDIGFVEGYIDIATLETFCSGTNGYVHTWYNQTGNTDITQTTNAEQPQIVLNGSFISDGVSFTAESSQTLYMLTYNDINITDAPLSFYINKVNHSVGYLFCKNTDDYADMQYAYIDDGFYLNAQIVFEDQVGPILFSWAGTGSNETIFKYGESSTLQTTWDITLTNRDYFILGARKNFSSFSYYATMNLKTILMFESDVSNYYSQLKSNC